MTTWYFRSIVCTECHRICELRQFQYSAQGTIRLKGWCYNCKLDRYSLELDMDALRLWAFGKDNPFPTEADKEWLHDLRVSFPDGETA